jgi:hypothetical protein
MLKEAVWNNPASGCASRSGPCGDCCILGRLATYFQYFPSRGAVRSDVELHLFRHRHPHVAPLSRRTSLLSCGDRITAVAGGVHFPRGPALFPFVHGYRSCRFSRLPVSSEGTSATAQWPLNRSSVTVCLGVQGEPDARAQGVVTAPSVVGPFTIVPIGESVRSVYCSSLRRSTNLCFWPGVS